MKQICGAYVRKRVTVKGEDTYDAERGTIIDVSRSYFAFHSLIRFLYNVG